MPRVCTQKNCCGLWKAASAFTPDNIRKTARRVCSDCTQQERRRCQACDESKLESEFTPSEWSRVPEHNSRGKCCTCMLKRPKGEWTCVQCKVGKRKEDFSAWSQAVKHQRPDLGTRCNACMELPQATRAWKCARCQNHKPVPEFSRWLQGRKIKKTMGKPGATHANF